MLSIGAAIAFDSGLLQGLDNYASARRMASDRQPASGNIVFLAIDKASLDAISTWPWKRSIHARILHLLSDAGAAEVYFDIDFSATSDPDEDRAFADAIGLSDALVVLPVFGQGARASQTNRTLSFNIPIPQLREASWLGTVNVSPDADGLVRRMPYGFFLQDQDIPSFPALLSGTFGPSGTGFTINYAIDPGTVPIVSVIDLLEGRVDAEVFSGKSIVVGADALELRDTFAVPVAGVISGPLLQILAAETLAQNLTPIAIDPRPILAVLALLLFAVMSSRWPGRLRTFAFLVAATGLAIEMVAFELQAHLNLALPTMAIHFLLGGVLLAAAGRELGLRKLWAYLASLEARNTHDVLLRVIRDSGDAVLVVDEDGKIIERNDRWLTLFGAGTTPGGAGWLDALPARIATDIRQAFVRAGSVATESPAPGEIEWVREDGRVFIEYTVTPSLLRKARHRNALRSDEIAFVCVSARDVTQRREQENRLEFLSRYDPQTGALRRNEMVERLERRLAEARGTGEEIAVWVFNLHRFKQVNATLGREVGDLLLTAVVERLDGLDLGLSRGARLGGNVFAVFNTRRIDDPSDMRSVSDQMARALGEPFVLNANTVYTGAAFGIASTFETGAADDSALAEALLDNAETALNEARKGGVRSVKLFDPVVVAQQERARALERELCNSIERDELFVLYQPQLRLSDMGFAGAEALVRWRHPDLGLVSPGEFIPVAETSGFILQIGQFVLRRACEDFARSGVPGSIAVNVSPEQLQQSDFLDTVRETLRDTGLPPARLHLEVTESIFVESSSQLREMLLDIRFLGISLALDDFGSGFSSFGYLSKFRFDKIKADQMFVRALSDNRANEGILRSIRLLSQELGTKLICEGIETEAQSDFLREIGCDEGQGYLFAKPMPLSELVDYARLHRGVDPPRVGVGAS